MQGTGPAISADAASYVREHARPRQRLGVRRCSAAFRAEEPVGCAVDSSQERESSLRPSHSTALQDTDRDGPCPRSQAVLSVPALLPLGQQRWQSLPAWPPAGWNENQAAWDSRPAPSHAQRRKLQRVPLRRPGWVSILSQRSGNHYPAIAHGQCRRPKHHWARGGELVQEPGVRRHPVSNQQIMSSQQNTGAVARHFAPESSRKMHPQFLHAAPGAADNPNIPVRSHLQTFGHVQ